MFWSCTGEAMNIQKYLDDLPRPVRVEAAYLAGRYLTHGLSADRFHRQLSADVKMEYTDQAAAAVGAIIAEIERIEGAPIPALPKVKRLTWASERGGALLADIRQRTDGFDVQEALAELRRVH